MQVFIILLSWRRAPGLVSALALGVFIAIGNGSAAERTWRLKPRAVSPAADAPALRSEAGFPCFLDHEGRRVPGGGIHALAGRNRPAAWKARPGPGRPASGGADTLRVAFLRVDFLTDRGGPLTTTEDGRFDLRRGVDLAVDPPPHDRRYFESHGEALRRYYAAQSGGRLEIAATVFPADSVSAFHLTDTMDYGPWSVLADNVNVALEAERLIKDALDAARQSGEVDFKSFDAFIVVHAGSDFQSDVNGDSERDIPTFVLEFGDTVVVDGRRIDRVMVLPETTTQDGFTGALNGVLAHEFGHILGLPDLYNTRTGIPAVGYWSLMDSGENIPAILVDTDGSEVEVFGALPSSLDAWSRLQLFLAGRFNADVVEAGESLDLTLPAALNGSRIVFAEIHESEYYLIENRALDLDGNELPVIRQDRTTGVILGPEADSTALSPLGRLEYDALLPGGGLLIWHVDDRVLAGDLADPFGVNTNLGRLGVKIMEADGIEDQGRRNLGTPFDPYFLGNNATLGPFTVPRSHSNDGQFSHVTVETASRPGPLMAVSVRRGLAVDGFPIGLSEELAVEEVGLADLTGDGSPEILFVVDENILAVEGKDGQPYPAPPPDAPPGSAIPWARHNSDLDQALAAHPAFLGRADGSGTDPIVAARARLQGRTVAWNGRTSELLGTFVDAATTPVIGPGFVAFGGFEGVLHVLAGVGTSLIPALDSEPHAGPPEAVAGNVLIGHLAGSAATDFVWSTASGRVHAATTGVNPVELPGILQTTGVSGIVGRAPLSLLAADFQGPSAAAYDVAAVDADGKASLVDLAGAVRPGWPVTLPAPPQGFPAAGDVDGDGSAELVVADRLGNLHVLNGDGGTARGFPRFLGSKPSGSPLLAELDENPGAEILLMTEDGSMHGLTRDGREIAGFPLAFGGRRILGPLLTDLDQDGRLDLAAGSALGLLVGASLGRLLSESAVVWGGDHGGPGRNAVLDRERGNGGEDLLAGRLPELVCFPNPARGDRLHVRLFLKEGQTARASVFDMLGRPVGESLRPAGSGAGGEADILWDLRDVSPGVYLVRVEVEGPDRPAVRWRTVSVVR